MAPSTPATDAGTRDRLIQAMTAALRRRGLHGVGLSELLAEAQAPKGVLYHHFPGGKTELAIAAIESAVAQLAGALDRLMQQQADPVAGLRSWMGSIQKQLRHSGFETGCPLATVALESTAEDAALRGALAAGFAVLRERVGAWLQSAGVPAARAVPLATLIVAAYEGALMQARVAGQITPMQDTTEALLGLIEHELATHRSSPPAP